MPRKKPTPAKPPVPIEIKPHEGARSPHVLNLRHENTVAQDEGLRLQGHNPTVPSLETRLAAFDERVKEVPDLLKEHAREFSALFSHQRQGWQSGFSAFLDQAHALGRTMQKRLGRVRRRRPKRHPSLQLPVALASARFGFLIVLLIVATLPLQGMLLYRAIHTTQATVLKNADEVKEHGQAMLTAFIARVREELAAAAQNLKGVRSSIDRFGPLRFLLPAQARSNYAILKLGEVTALAGLQILDQALAVENGTGTTVDLLLTAQSEAGYMRGRLQSLLGKNNLQPMLSHLSANLNTLTDTLTVLNAFLGIRQRAHILLVFENPRELRATGGFAGSLALLTFDKGRIVTQEIPEGGSYDFQGQLIKRSLSPLPLQLINPRFELQDANWWPNFPTSARKMAEIYESAGGSTLDGVIAITANVGTEILRATSALTVSGLTITPETFIDALQDIIVQDRALNRKAPKKIITELFPAFMERGTDLLKNQPATLATLLAKAVSGKDLQLWSRGEETQAALSRLGAAGEMKETAGDYLAVVSANVGGGKTDGIVREEISHRAQITRQNTVRTTLTVSRTHTGARGNRVTGARNVSYIRAYVPKGARFISATGFNAPAAHLFEIPDSELTPDPEVRAQEVGKIKDEQSATEIWSEFGKTVFGNWIVTDPGQTSAGTIIYEVPLAVTSSSLPYMLIIEPQAGKAAQLTSQVALEDGLALLTGDGAGTWKSSGWSFEGLLDKTVVASGTLYKL